MWRWGTPQNFCLKFRARQIYYLRALIFVHVSGSARTFVHAKLHVHKTVTVGANLHLIYNLLIAIVFPYIFCNQLTLKNISRRYAQHKGFSRFNWITTNGLKIDQSRKPRYLIRDIHSRIWFYFLMKFTWLWKTIDWVHKNKLVVATIWNTSYSKK